MGDKKPTVKQLMELAKRSHKASGIILPACDYLSYYFSKPFLYLPLTPNQITVMWISIKIIAASFMLKGDYLVTIIALLIFQVASIIDGVDGVIARYRKHFSLNGIYLDYIGHYLCNSVLFIALAFGLFTKAGSYYVFIPAAIAVFSMLLSKALTINPWWYQQEKRAEVEKAVHEEGLSIIMEQKAGMVSGMMAKMKILFFDLVRIDNPLNLMFWGILAGFAEVTLWVYAVFLLLEMLRKLWLQYWRIYKAERGQQKQR